MKTFFRKIKRVCVQIGPYGLLFAMLLGVFGFQNAKREFHIFKETNLQLTLTKIPGIRKLVNTVIMEV